MERIHARALETENRVRMLETHGLRLQAQQGQRQVLRLPCITEQGRG